jgi:hypothetical protein
MSAALSFSRHWSAGALLRKRLRRREPSGKMARRLHQLLQGLAPLGSPRDFLPSLGISLLLWGTVILTYRFAFYATDLRLPSWTPRS